MDAGKAGRRFCSSRRRYAQRGMTRSPVVQTFLHESERDTFLRPATGRDGMPMSFDHSDKLVQGVQPLPLEARAPPVEEAARPWLACQPEQLFRLRRATGAADVSPRHFALDGHVTGRQMADSPRRSVVAPQFRPATIPERFLECARRVATRALGSLKTPLTPTCALRHLCVSTRRATVAGFRVPSSVSKEDLTRSPATQHFRCHSQYSAIGH